MADENKFLEVLLEKEWIPFDKIRRFVAMVDEFKAIGVETTLKELLLARGLLTKEQADAIQEEVNKAPSANDTRHASSQVTALTGSSSVAMLKSAELYGSSSYIELEEDDLVDFEDTDTIPLVDPPDKNSRGSRPQVGKTFGKYKILNEIGRGGMATIYEVWDEELRRTVAMKVLTLGRKDSKKARARFISEAQATSQLQHPNIIPIHDIGYTEGKLPFFTMDIVRGHSLEEVINHLALGDPDFLQIYPRIRLLNIFIKMCEAVSYAHSKGVIHRDIKPQNIMVGPFGEVYIMDWGLAKFLKNTSSGVWTERQEKAWVTQQGSVVGTPTYMAPEQAKGEVEKVDERTDVYALGTILYEILTFRPPFTSESIEETYHKVLHTDPPNPQQVALGEEPAKELGAIALKALNKNRIMRYPNVAALKQEVQRYLDNKEIEALPDNLPRKVLRMISRYRWVGVAAGFAFLTLLLIWSLARSGEVSSSLSGNSKLIRAWKMAALSGKSDKVPRYFEEALKKAEREEERAEILRHRARYYLYINDFQKAKRDLDKGAKEEGEEEAQALFLRYCLASYHGDLKEGEKWLKKLRSEKEGPYHHFAIGLLLYEEEGDLEGAMAQIDKALKSDGFYDSLWAYLARGQIFYREGLRLFSQRKFKRAKELFEKAEEEFQRGNQIFIKEAIFYVVKSRYNLARYEYLEEYDFKASDFEKRYIYNQTLKMINQAIDLVPSNGYFYFLRGKAHANRGYPSLSRKDFAKAKKLDPSLAKKITKFQSNR